MIMIIIIRNRVDGILSSVVKCNDDEKNRIRTRARVFRTEYISSVYDKQTFMKIDEKSCHNLLKIVTYRYTHFDNDVLNSIQLDLRVVDCVIYIQTIEISCIIVY